MVVIEFSRVIFVVAVCTWGVGTLGAHGQSCVLGIETMTDAFVKSLAGLRIGFVSNQTGKDTRGRRSIDIVREHGLTVSCIFAPEHGFEGTMAAETEVCTSRDDATGLPIIGLHRPGGELSFKRGCAKEFASHVDAFMIDLQDCGMRHFTYISTLYTILDWAAHHAQRVIVLDRPNPLGDCMEGPLVESSCSSFVSIAPVPLRHGMTMGELALYFNAHVLLKPAELNVVTMHSYDRSKGLCGTFLARLSPHLTSLQACYGYSFLGVIGEIRPFDVGLHMDLPFQAIILPSAEPTPGADRKRQEETWRALAKFLQRFGIETKPCCVFDEKKKLFRPGLIITSFADITKVPSFGIFLALIGHARKLGLEPVFSDRTDRALGTRKVHAYVNGDISYHELATVINDDLKKFWHKARSCFLYEPAPRIVTLDIGLQPQKPLLRDHQRVPSTPVHPVYPSCPRATR